MKKIKILIPALSIAAIAGTVPVIASCSCSTSQIDVLDIDADSNIVRGFKPGLTEQQISDACQGTLTIPVNVVGIAPYAFYDVATGKSTIPSSVKNLIFEENIDIIDGKTKGTFEVIGYSALHNEQWAVEAAIGQSAFKKAPFTYIKLPVGSGYDIGERAFENTKITCLDMPHPRYNEKLDFEDEEHPERKIITGKEIQGHWWRGFLTEFETVGANYFTLHNVNIRNKAFYNIPTLKAIILSPLVTMKQTSSQNSSKVFSLLDADGNETYSNVRYLDASNISPCRYNDGKDEYGFYGQRITSSEWKSNYDTYIISSGIEPWKICEGMADSLFNFNEAPETMNNTEFFYLVLNSVYSDQGDNESQKSFANNFLSQFGAPATASDPWPATSYYALVPSINNYCKDPTASNIKTIDLLSTELTQATVSVASTKTRLDRCINLPFAGNESAVKTYGLRGNVQFNITKAEWAKEADAVELSLDQIKIDELQSAAAKKAFINNQYTVVWKQAPKAGSKVTLTFDAYCVDMMRYTPNMKVEITFTE